jgi:C-terminal peptidase prc
MYMRIIASALFLVLVLPCVAPAQEEPVSWQDSWDYWQAMSLLTEHYYDKDAVKNVPLELPIRDANDRDKKISEAVKSLKNPWTNYYPPYGWPDHKDTPLTAGVGITEAKDDFPTVNLVEFGTSGEKAGLKRGDRLLSVNGKSLKGLDQEEVYETLRGKAGQRMDVEFRRSGTKFHAWITFVEPPPAVQVKLLEGNIVYIHIRDFVSDKMLEQFADAVANLYVQTGGDLRGIILDLRGNTGGYMWQAYTLLGALIEKGKVGTQKGRDGDHEQTAKAWVKDYLIKHPRTKSVAAKVERALWDLPMVELVNESTMSAAEATTAALKDRERATVIGEKTWGKGMYYNTIPLDSGGYLMVVSGKFHGPQGMDHHGVGITPNRYVADTRDFRSDPPLQAGLAYLSLPSLPPPSVVQPPADAPSSWFTYSALAGLLLALVLGLVMLRWSNRRRQQRRLEKILARMAGGPDAEDDDSVYLPDGRVDWATVLNSPPVAKRRPTMPSQSPCLITMQEMPPDHFFAGAGCHHCHTVMEAGDLVAEVVDGSESYFCCMGCAAPSRKPAAQRHQQTACVPV